MFPPDGLSTTEQANHDVELNPHIIAPDPFVSDDCFNDLTPVHPSFIKTTLEENMMNPGADEPSSGLNGRLRPRKSNIPSPQPTKLVRKSEGKTGQEKAKRRSAASKTPPNKTDDLATKSDSILLCPYCDKNFASKQTLSKHVRRMHAAGSKQDSFIACLFCGHYEADTNDIIRHMAETHPQQYFACLNCHTRFSSSVELAEHKIKSCETKLPYRSRLRQKVSIVSIKETHKDELGNDSKVFTDGHSFNGVVISCELKPSLVSDGADIEDNITTNLILPPSKNLGSSTVIEKSAVIVLDDIQWNKRIPPNFSFHNTDADQILSRLGVVHRSPRAGESTKKDWKNLDETTQKFEKCFDTSFYSKVASNVQENLSKFLDGSFNFNPDPDSTIKTRKSKNSVVINTAEGFPILLASEQYSRNAFDRYMPRAIAPKHKWKWDNLESEKGPINPDQIKRDSHTNNCIITLVSSLDIWTQLRMRRKFEEKFGCPPLEKKTEKQTIISNELKGILESRELPTPLSQVMKMKKKAAESTGRSDFPLSLGLTPSTSAYELQPAVLSGEWVRPRCYVCCACGAQSRDSRAVSAHVSAHHPNAQVQHYEIVGEQLLNADILKHLYVPPSQMCNRTRPPRGFRECTKCRKSITLDDLHQHMLDCAGDTPAVRRKCRYRPFGVRRRRPRLPDNTIRRKIRKDIRTRQTRPKTLIRPRPIRTEVGDAETIRKMIADLPAKRHRVVVNPTNPSLRPRIKQRPKILMKKRPSEDFSKRIKRNKESNETRLRSGTPANDATSTKSDEDNKPLKPKIRRVASKTPRRSEPDKRKTTVLTRAKRLNRQVKKAEENDSVVDATTSACSSKTVMTEDISIENLPQRIDVKNNEFKTREHAGQGQGSSNNRGGQREGNSGQNSNSGNRCTPASNVPLKHSIARLTADSEKHDKSVQFHQLFLIQQECNNVNQHVQSGQRLLFENEAAVLTLDKPPLHYNNKGPLDALQRSKLNKSRKGLNACIAMLKNKLVEPAESTIPAGHVSVQCGDDEPLYTKPDTLERATANLETNVDNVTKIETKLETGQNKSVSRVRPVETLSLQPAKQDALKTTLEATVVMPVQSSNKDTKSIESHINDKNQITPQNLYEVTMSEKQLDLQANRFPSRRKTTVNEVKTIELPYQPLPVLQANAPRALTAPETIISIEIVPVAARFPQQENSKRPIDKSVTNKWPNTVTNAGKDKQNTKSREERPTNQQSPLVKTSNTSCNQTSIENQVFPDLAKQTMTNPQSSINEKNLTIKEQHSNVYYGNCLNLQQQTDNHSDSEYNRKVTVENFPSAEFNHVPVNNRPAHASTHIESIVSIPLDLSGKPNNVNASQDLSKTQNTYFLGTTYDTYETLDLSNKSQDLEYTGETISLPNDEIVDLSLKSSQLMTAEVDIVRKNDVTDLSLKSCLDVPTDLTIKKKVNDNSTKPFVEISHPSATRESAPIRDKRNLDKAMKLQIGSNICELPTADVHIKDKKVSCINLTTSKENVNIIDPEPPSKSEIFMNVVTENSLEIVHENLPSDLTCQQRTEDILKEPSTPQQISASFGKKEDDADKNQEKYFQVHPRTCDRTFQIHKPIYDPTLKIPQYKIRVAATFGNPPNKDLLAANITAPPSFPLVTNYSDSTQKYTQSLLTTTSEVKTSLDIQDQLKFTIGTAPHVPSSNTPNIYAITNTGITSHFNKFESTTPVYTLTKACISVTKIESTNSTTLTNTLLSIPGTTIANTTPVYTLAGTTIGIQGNYSHVVSEVPINSANQKYEENILPGTSIQGKIYEKELEIHKETVISTNVLSNVDQDPETARKIALLPKELVDVLGNMPVDHRNRLLNILPQYVSTSTSDSGLKSELSNQSESTGKLTISLEPNEVPSVPKNTDESESKMTSPLRSSNSSKPSNNENTPSRTPLAHPATFSVNNSINSDDVLADESFTIQTHTISKDEQQAEGSITKSDEFSENASIASSTKRLSISHSVSVDKIIDLTEDEALTRTQIHNEPIVEVPPQMSLLVQTQRNKSNNDQTASLRAVRIKAPSARQRSIDSQLAKYTSMTPILTNKMNNNEHDNEVEKSLHVNVSLNTDISLAIQQAEVSSTQHSSKNVAAECKFPTVTSPNVQESNLDETNSCARRLSTASKDQNIKIDDIHNILLKTTLVTSSVVNNEINKDPPQVMDKEYISLNSDLPDSKYIHSMKLDISSELTKNNGAAITKSSLDDSESYDLPVNCSTPKTGKETQVLVTPPERRISVASEGHEDSDDDLSLAVICKQKQQNLPTIYPVKDLNNCEKDGDIATKKKGKKNKKSEKNRLVAHASSRSNNNTVSLDNEKPISVIDMESDKHSTKAPVEESLKQNNRKHRLKNIAKNMQSDTTNTTPHSVMNIVAVDNTNDEIRIDGNDIDENTNHINDIKLSIGTSRKRSKVNEEIMINVPRVQEKNDELKTKASIVRQKNKKKKRTPTSQPDCVTNETRDEKNNEKTEATSTPDKNTTDPSGSANTKALGLKVGPDTAMNETLRSTELTNVDVTTSFPVVVVPLTSNSSLEEASNIITPLRRSRRVRSRNNSIAAEELHVDTLQENRTPLTKKQLIFSKLLLDEENNVKNPESDIVDGDKVCAGENVDNLRKTSTPEVVAKNEIEDSVPVDSNIKEKNKSVKRKKSVNSKRKFKKRKPIDTEFSYDEDGVEEGTDITLQGQTKDCVSTSHEEQRPSDTLHHSFDDSDICAPSISDTASLTASSVEPFEISSAVSIEKRKSGDLPNAELLHSSQPKKIKLNATEETSDDQRIVNKGQSKFEKEALITSHAIHIKNDTSDSIINNTTNVIEKSDTIPKTCLDEQKQVTLKGNENYSRIKTCYNMPAAGRRTRSKSAVIKSVVYDPYDIDMDDMIEHAEPLRQRKTSTEYRSSTNAKQFSLSKEIKSVEVCEEDRKKLQFCSKHDESDSDDSSKSDVPLKKYVEEKEKKICGLDRSTSKPKNDAENELNSDKKSSKKCSIIDKKNRRTLGVCNTDEGVAQDETEQELRSEQFMESFGFFSERKPRKSNLLATKKISETFHIIANEAEELLHQERNSKKERNMQNENIKSVDRDSNAKASRQRSPLSKKPVKRGRKKKNSTTVTTPSYCNICKKEFRRSDNFIRHQMTLLHVSKMSEVEMKIKTVPIQEEPNYLIAYKDHLDRLKIITDKMLKRKKNSKSAPKITPLSLEEILADVNRIVREQQLSHRGLSCDEELFLDCCELLKESHKKQDPVADIPSIIKDTDDLLCPSQAANVGLDLLGKTDIDVKSDNNKNDGDVDSITAKTILESEEVRNLENDLISGLKEAANASNLNKAAIVFQQTVNDVDQNHLQDFSDHFSSPAASEAHYEQLNNYEEPVELNAIKDKKYPEYKEKMYPDVEEFDMFEDKFDKIKRKCRSQAAAAKQPQLVVEPSISRKGRKKTDKKKGKKNSKKNHPNTVLTKGALKGFDGIKVSIPTSDINISAIVSPLDNSHKKKKKSTLRKKRENKHSESSSKYDSDHPLNDSSTFLKNVDVYEFMDNEDVELFEFRPSTLMERFKSITNKDTPSTSKVNPVVEEADHSSASGSDGDDFVYMSDDYVCSDDETENSLMSCDVSNTKISVDTKKLSSQMKKRDAVEKNAVMGKIFKNNAVRSEKKTTKSKEPVKPKANLDQLFDSLLEDEPSSSMLNDESLPLNDEASYTSKYENIMASPSPPEELLPKYEQYHSKKKNNFNTDKENYSSKYKNHSSDIDDDEPSSFIDYGPSTSKLCLKSFIGDHKSTKPGLRPSLSPPELKPVSPKKCDNNTPLKKHERMSFIQDDYLEDTGASRKGTEGMKKNNSKSKDDKSPVRKIGDSFGISSDYNEIGLEDFTSDETGVARQRARRKCTVGKQNILAETWSSESEPDGGPPRPNSAGSMASGTTRKKKGKKKDWQHSGGRRTNSRHISFKKQEIVSRVSSSMRNTAMHKSGTSNSEAVDNMNSGSTLGSSERSAGEVLTDISAATASGDGCKSVEEPPAIPSTSSGASISSPSAGPSTSTEGAAGDQSEPTFLVPAEPSTSGGVRTRMYGWSSDGSDNEQVREALAREELARAEREHARVEDAQQQQQQHGWIVGDSHKKLVTMLAHAKGRKRNNNDDKRHKTE